MTTTDRPNWPDYDPRWLRAIYEELIRLQAMLERAVDYRPTPRKSIDHLKGDILLGACFALVVIGLVIPFLR